MKEPNVEGVNAEEAGAEKNNVNKEMAVEMPGKAPGKRHRKSHGRVRAAFCIIGLQFLCVTISTGIGLPLSMQKWAFIFLSVITTSGFARLYVRARVFWMSKWALLFIAFIYVLVFGSLGLQMSKMPDMVGHPIGNNANTFSYCNDIFAETYSSVDEVISAHRPEGTFQEFKRFEDEESAGVFYYSPASEETSEEAKDGQAADALFTAPQVQCIEIYKENGRYYYAGVREMSAAGMDSYSEEETMRADLAESLAKKSILPGLKETFAWGLSRYPHMDQVTVDGAPCREIVPLTLKDGGTGYFWLADHISVDLDPWAAQISGLPGTLE